MSDKKTVFMVDSGCEPTPEFLQAYDPELVGLKVILDNQSYVDGEEVFRDQFYARADKIKKFATNPPSVYEMINRYLEIQKKGADRVIAIHMSSKMSKIYEHSKEATEFVPGLETHVFDTNSAATGSYLVAHRIIELFNEGRSIEEIELLLPEIKQSTQVLLVVSTLKHFVKNGRIGKAKGLVGQLLRLKPLLVIKDGQVSPFSREKGIDRAIDRMANVSAAFLKSRPYNIKIYKGYGAVNNKPYMDRAFKILIDKLHEKSIDTYKVISGRGWPTITCHTGPEVFTLSVYGERYPL